MPSHMQILVGRQGFEPWKPLAADLQSAPVVHLGTCPLRALHSGFFLKPSIVKGKDKNKWRDTIPDESRHTRFLLAAAFVIEEQA